MRLDEMVLHHTGSIHLSFDCDAGSRNTHSGEYHAFVDGTQLADGAVRDRQRKLWVTRLLVDSKRCSKAVA